MKVDDLKKKTNTNLTCYDTSRAPDRRRAPHTGRGSDSFVLIEVWGFYPKFYGIVCLFLLRIVLASDGRSDSK